MKITDILTAFVADARNRTALIAGLATLTLGGNLLALLLGAPEAVRAYEAEHGGIPALRSPAP